MDQINTKKLFVGNLNPMIGSDELYQIFSEYGWVVDADVIYDNETGKSKGWGFVEMGSESDAAKAVHQLNGSTSTMNGGRIYVAIARPKRLR
jgi:RNA recognition motif-containing protein